MSDGGEDRAGPPAFAIGQDLSLLSVEELDRLIAALRAEIARLEAEKAAKSDSRQAADAIFRR
ncbi:MULTISPECIES: DUF1192 domain-containing protein [unclassified Roseitalea]|uniref:DUF1192 domain-containing protein n=1 Tax=unclassified Roseitalea TaxID=2639107 RepID=UPI00273F5746|nr:MULTISPECIES: DUF1192 domain-containing protein [unclassified Roseitalea]